MCVHIYCRVFTAATPICDLLANAITMSDEERVELMEKFKKHELSEIQVLSKVTNNFVYRCVCVCVCVCTLYFVKQYVLSSKKKLPS